MATVSGSYPTDSGIPYGWYKKARTTGLAAAIRGDKSPPCIGCPNANNCRENQLACLDFATYAHTYVLLGDRDDLQDSRHATRGIYNLIFLIRCSKRGCGETTLPPAHGWGLRVTRRGNHDACPIHREF